MTDEHTLNAIEALCEYETWERVAAEIGEHDYTYDLSDNSHRLDVVQIVCEAAARVLVEHETTSTRDYEQVGLLIGDAEFIPQAVADEHYPFAVPPGVECRAVFARPPEIEGSGHETSET